MTPKKILHLDSNHPLLLQKLSEAGFINETDFTSDKAAIEDKISNYHGLIIRSRFSIDQSFLEKAKNLEFIARVGAGLENIDCEFASGKGIALIAAPEGNRNAVAEHALGMLLSLFNKLNLADAEIRNGQWNREKNRGHELDGKTVGIIGYGNMGKAFAKKLRGFDVEVLFYDILPNIGDANARQVSIEELQQKADVLSLHVPQTEKTIGLVNLDFINAFSKPIWLINTSRGKNVITSDLIAALENGKLLGAALDVLEFEKSSFENMFSDGEIPDAFSALLKSDKVLLSPHVAGWTFESHERLAEVIADKIIEKCNPSNQKQELKRVTGIGGFFFKAKDPKALRDWYKQHLGLKTDDYGCTFWWKDAAGNDCSTQWSPFGEDTKYYEPSQKPFMQNFRVADLDALLRELKQQGIPIVGEPESFDYGKFAWILDPEGNKIELWQPIDKAFL